MIEKVDHRYFCSWGEYRREARISVNHLTHIRGEVANQGMNYAKFGHILRLTTHSHRGITQRAKPLSPLWSSLSLRDGCIINFFCRWQHITPTFYSAVMDLYKRAGLLSVDLIGIEWGLSTLMRIGDFFSVVTNYVFGDQAKRSPRWKMKSPSLFGIKSQNTQSKRTNRNSAGYRTHLFVIKQLHGMQGETIFGAKLATKTNFPDDIAH